MGPAGYHQMLTVLRGLGQEKTVAPVTKQEAEAAIMPLLVVFSTNVLELQQCVMQLSKKVDELSNQVEVLKNTPVTIDGYTAESELKEHLIVLVGESKKSKAAHS